MAKRQIKSEEIEAVIRQKKIDRRDAMDKTG